MVLIMLLQFQLKVRNFSVEHLVDPSNFHFVFLFDQIWCHFNGLKSLQFNLMSIKQSFDILWLK